MQHNTTHHDALSAEQSEMECHVTFIAPLWLALIGRRTCD